MTWPDDYSASDDTTRSVGSCMGRHPSADPQLWAMRCGGSWLDPSLPLDGHR
jgi:hypothetical protein